MNELALSTDINQIELEINYHKQIAGQSIWEIGRRLNHVKENDLAHGEFGKWLKKIGIERSEATRFMTVARELPNCDNWHHLSNRAIYLMATLPNEEKERMVERVESGERIKIKEIEELKRQNRLKDEQLKQKDERISNQAEVIEQLSNQEPEIREIEVEKKPDDYEFYKERTEVLQEEVKQLEESYRDLLKKRSEVDEKSLKYEELTKAINQAKGELGDTQKIISNYADLSKLLKESNEFLLKASGLVYSDLTEVIERDGIAKQELDFLINRLERFTSDLIGLTQNNILEGEIING